MAGGGAATVTESRMRAGIIQGLCLLKTCSVHLNAAPSRVFLLDATPLARLRASEHPSVTAHLHAQADEWLKQSPQSGLDKAATAASRRTRG